MITIYNGYFCSVRLVLHTRQFVVHLNQTFIVSTLVLYTSMRHCMYF